MASRFEQTYQTRVTPAALRAFGVTVRFVRNGVYISDEFTCRRNDRVHKALGADYGIEVSLTMRQYILQVSDVAIDGDLIEPRAGDQIVEGDEIFEIQPPDDVKQAVELQAGGFEWIVQTKRVES